LLAFASLLDFILVLFGLAPNDIDMKKKLRQGVNTALLTLLIEALKHFNKGGCVIATYF